VNSEYVSAKKSENLTKATLEAEQIKYTAAYSAYNGALQANATAAGGQGGALIEQEDLDRLKSELTSATASYNKAQDAYIEAHENAGVKEQAHYDCQQEIIRLNREVGQAKAEAMALLRKLPEYKVFMKDVTECITVSYAKDEDGEIIKSTIRVSIAVDKKVANSEEFAKELAERVREELPPFIVEKVDYATAYCEHTNVLDEVEQINKKDLIMNPVKAGLIGGLLVLFVVCSIYLVKEKDAYVVTVTRNDED
jgi:hypothetical protein